MALQGIRQIDDPPQSEESAACPRTLPFFRTALSPSIHPGTPSPTQTMSNPVPPKRFGVETIAVGERIHGQQTRTLSCNRCAEIVQSGASPSCPHTSLTTSPLVQPQNCPRLPRPSNSPATACLTRPADISHPFKPARRRNAHVRKLSTSVERGDKEESCKDVDQQELTLSAEPSSILARIRGRNIAKYFYTSPMILTVVG